MDGACHVWWPGVLSVSKSVCTEQGSTEFRTPLCNLGYAPDNAIPYSTLRIFYVHEFITSASVQNTGTVL